MEGWARDGLTDEQISKNLGIAYLTFKEYKKNISDFSDSLKKAKRYSALSAPLKRGKEVFKINSNRVRVSAIYERYVLEKEIDKS